MGHVMADHSKVPGPPMHPLLRVFVTGLLWAAYAMAVITALIFFVFPWAQRFGLLK
jgi:uncharacterized membrane protein